MRVMSGILVAIFLDGAGGGRLHFWKSHSGPDAADTRGSGSGPAVRRHLHESIIQRVFKAIVWWSGLTKHARLHAPRHSFAKHLLEDAYDIRMVQELSGHSDVAATMLYTYVLNNGSGGVRSPLDAL